ncbi:hypothetical protein HDV01_002264 [Terramyces sp. JEL0728]|nr:hypothetical protein HDV01_002264 [Terramyces sp. JEL0728]
MKRLLFQVLSVVAQSYSSVEITTAILTAVPTPEPTPTLIHGSPFSRPHHSHDWNPPTPTPVAPAGQTNSPPTSNQSQQSGKTPPSNTNNNPIQINSISISQNKTDANNSQQNQVGQLPGHTVDGNPIAPPTGAPTNTTPSGGMQSGTNLTSTTIILFSFGISVFLVIATVFGIKSYQANRKKEFSFSSGDSKQSFSRADSPPLPSPIYETEFNFTELDRIPIDLNMFLPNKPANPSPLAISMNISTTSSSCASSSSSL